MTEQQPAQPDFLDELGHELGQVWRDMTRALSNSGLALRNQLRHARQAKLDYVVMPISGSLPERDAPPRSFIQRQLPLPAEPMSLETLNRRLQKIADASNVKGIVFIFQGFSAGLATLQNFRSAVLRLKAAGKEVVVYTPYLDLPHYFAASAADRIFAPPSTQFDVLGLRSETVFLKDVLAQLGVEADVIQISPYKTAFDMFAQADMSDQLREQVNWLLDSIFDTITAAIAADRGKTQEEIKDLIDRSPLFAEEAHAFGLLDGLGYEDSLVYDLAQPSTAPTRPPAENPDTEADSDKAPSVENEPEEKEEEKRPKVTLRPWYEARGMLLEKPKRPSRKYIGVVSLTGTITMGPSRQPPIDIPLPFVGGASAGEETIVQLLREAEEDDQIAALIFHIDSGGGSALASDLIYRQLERIAKNKPVVAYMGNAAASGGYYVAAAAQHIMAQPLTITGSIGVITAHISTAELYQKIQANRVSITRGKRAGLYTDEAPLTTDEREILWAGVVDTYQQFKKVVAKGRDLPLTELDPICEGRVWTGEQALHHRLVDTFGDFQDAVQKTAELAELPTGPEDEIQVYNLHHPERDYQLPQPYEAASEIIRLFSADEWRQMLGRPLMMLPYRIKFW